MLNAEIRISSPFPHGFPIFKISINSDFSEIIFIYISANDLFININLVRIMGT